MQVSRLPRPYREWRKTAFDHAEDAAYTFGFHLMQHCRAEALKTLASASVPATQDEFRTLVTEAVDVALHNVMDLLEGFWPTDAGSEYPVSYALSVCVRDKERRDVEHVPISPCLLDLPIGYWKWTEGEFR